MKPLKILFAASEAAPYAKTGGLGDVCGALPKSLKKLGCEVILIMPFYRQIDSEFQNTNIQVSLQVGDREIAAQLFQTFSNDVSTYFLKCDEYFDREYLYGTPDSDYPDNLERWTFFSKAVLEAVKKLDFKPDIIHCHDWQTGLIPAYLKTICKDDPFFLNTKTLFTIHNIAYQGLFPSSLFSLTGLPLSIFNPEGIEYWGKINLLKAGIVFSEIETTVSEKYAQEIQTNEAGCGLEGVLQARKDKLFGILNGVDYDEWNPSKDRFIAANYDNDNLTNKKVCRTDLLKVYDLEISEQIPLIGIISRFVEQKGFDILSEAMEEIMSMNVCMVVVGSGEKKYSDIFLTLARKYPEKLGVKIAFDNAIAHKITAGSDMILMPSLFEPCGMTQMYSLKYGTIPIVRATGGLDDTIEDFDVKTGSGTGFKFIDYNSGSLLKKVEEAVQTFDNKQLWNSLMQNAMKQDFSWERSAKRYVELYEKLCK
ncbi:MAG: glycogen synthase GlgA [Deltaproteobacteria bacterium]|nr:glycogen synthase GlgA [Deltaproteobacteria bacterium]